MKEFIRTLKFTLISASAGLIQHGSFTLFYNVFKWNYWIAYITGLTLSVLWNFTINRKYTFRSANNIKVAMLLVFSFYVVFTPVSALIGAIVEGKGVNGQIVEIVTMLANFVLEFLFTRFVVYRGSCDTAISKEEK